MDPRRAEIEITYEGVNISQDIAPFFNSLTYTDNGTGKADDLQVSLTDSEGKWRDPWMPKEGDSINANIILYNWDREGSKHSLPCGSFQVDSVNYTGPPDLLNIKALSLPSGSHLKNEAKTKAWEKIMLSQIAKRIADNAGMKLLFETDDVTYDRVDQTEQSDIAFLSYLAEKEGITVKVTNNTIVLFDDRKYESMKPVRSIKRGDDDLKSYVFDLSTIGVAYSACEVSYFDEKKKTIRGSFKAPDSKSGPVLKINERVSSVAEATRKAKNALRQTNKEAQKASLTLMGDYRLIQGVTIDLKGFGRFDAKYYVETATHSVSSRGYETSIELRKVLGY